MAFHHIELSLYCIELSLSINHSLTKICLSIIEKILMKSLLSIMQWRNFLTFAVNGVYPPYLWVSGNWLNKVFVFFWYSFNTCTFFKSDPDRIYSILVVVKRYEGLIRTVTKHGSQLKRQRYGRSFRITTSKSPHPWISCRRCSTRFYTALYTPISKWVSSFHLFVYRWDSILSFVWIRRCTWWRAR